MIVYAAMKCECVYESGFEVLSLHTTKAGAYRVCREWWLKEWNGWNDDVKGSGYHGVMSPKECRRNPNTVTGSKRWTVKACPVIPDNRAANTQAHALPGFAIAEHTPVEGL